MSIFDKLKDKVTQARVEREEERKYRAIKEKEIKAKEQDVYYQGLEKGRLKSARQRGYSEGTAKGGSFFEGLGKASQAFMNFGESEAPRRKGKGKRVDPLDPFGGMY